MKLIEFLAIAPLYAQAVISQCGGWEQFKIVAYGVLNSGAGAGAGWTGFNDDAELVVFFNANKADIISSLQPDIYTKIAQLDHQYCAPTRQNIDDFLAGTGSCIAEFSTQLSYYALESLAKLFSINNQ